MTDRGNAATRSGNAAERDGTTVEIAFALLTGALLGTLVVLALSAPVLLGRAHGHAAAVWWTTATVTGCTTGLARVVSVLWRYDRRRRLSRAIPAAPAPTRRPARRVGHDPGPRA
ncbi:DUF6332 family protein [Streptomyces sp. ICBB 8177]|uniref:DUF6332 family protein n=1 Tax=Streptomyces sp. ICBB 8177 TaxID=563922 RepID=UPI0011B5B7DE|nr:DUF6332 family protein [Streptomyces sp. ICBB 8177]